MTDIPASDIRPGMRLDTPSGRFSVVHSVVEVPRPELGETWIRITSKWLDGSLHVQALIPPAWPVQVLQEDDDGEQ